MPSANENASREVPGVRTREGWDTELEERLLRFLNGTPPLPAEVRRRAAMTVADVVAAAVAASAVEESAAVLRNVPSPAGASTFIGLNRCGPAEWAALVNTTQGILEEVEEGHNLGGHVGVATVMATLAAAEEAGQTPGNRIIEAVARAYEVTARVEYALMAVRADLNQATEWVIRNPHSTWTVLGAALGAALVQDTSDGREERLRHVLRMGLNLATVSMWDPFADGAPARNFTAGLSAQTGVSAARLALSGVQGSSEAIQRVLGPARRVRGAAFDGSFQILGADWWIVQNYFKMAPSCRYTQPPLQALMQIRDQLDPEQIDRVEVYTFRSALPMSHQRALNRTSAKFSIPYVVAYYVLRGEPGLDAFDGGALQDEAVHRLAHRVTVHHDPEIEASFPNRWLARVEVIHRDGRRIVAPPCDALGDWQNPMSEAQLKERWLTLLQTRYPAARAREILDGLLGLDDQRDVKRLMGWLSNDEERGC